MTAPKSARFCGSPRCNAAACTASSATPVSKLYATRALGFSDNRYYQFKRLADDLDRLPILREAVETGGIGWTKALQVARVATEATQAAWVEKAATTGRRELELQVRQARKRRPAARAAQLTFDTVAQPVADPPTTISLRADGVRRARFEALVEKAHKLGLVPAGGWPRRPDHHPAVSRL